jgi:hypothetical protein
MQNAYFCDLNQVCTVFSDAVHNLGIFCHLSIIYAVIFKRLLLGLYSTD